MKVITVTGLSLQFDSNGNPDPLAEAREVLNLVNNALASGPYDDCSPAILGGASIDRSNIEVEEDEEDEWENEE